MTITENTGAPGAEGSDMTESTRCLSAEDRRRMLMLLAMAPESFADMTEQFGPGILAAVLQTICTELIAVSVRAEAPAEEQPDWVRDLNPDARSRAVVLAPDVVAVDGILYCNGLQIGPDDGPYVALGAGPKHAYMSLVAGDGDISLEAHADGRASVTASNFSGPVSKVRQFGYGSANGPSACVAPEAEIEHLEAENERLRAEVARLESEHGS